MKKIRLIITKDCPNNCLKCCNKNFDLDSLPIVKDYDCDELIITGGEPMIRSDFEECVHYFKEKDCKTELVLSTNATLIDEFWLQAEEENLPYSRNKNESTPILNKIKLKQEYQKEDKLSKINFLQMKKVRCLKT